MLLILMCGGYASLAQPGTTPIGKREWLVPPLPLQGGDIVYTETVPNPRSVAQQYNNAESWYMYNYKSADTRLTTQDLGGGRLAGTGVLKYEQSGASPVNQTLFFDFDIQMQQGSYTYRISNIYGILDGKKVMYNDMYREDRQPPAKPRWTVRYRYEQLSDMNTFIGSAINHLKKEMAKAE